jgi:hypothetical protein
MLRCGVGSIACLAWLTGCNTPSSSNRAEELRLPFPIPSEDWKYEAGKSKHETVATWSKTNEHLILTITHLRPTKTPKAWRDDVEAYAKTNLLEDYQSEILREGLRNNYRLLEWKTEATSKKGGFPIVNLSLYIEGEDAGYFISKRWSRVKPSEAELMHWRDYFDSIQVADDRKPNHRGSLDLLRVRSF